MHVTNCTEWDFSPTSISIAYIGQALANYIFLSNVCAVYDLNASIVSCPHSNTTFCAIHSTESCPSCIYQLTFSVSLPISSPINASIVDAIFLQNSINNRFEKSIRYTSYLQNNVCNAQQNDTCSYSDALSRVVVCNPLKSLSECGNQTVFNDITSYLIRRTDEIHCAQHYDSASTFQQYYSFSNGFKPTNNDGK